MNISLEPGKTYRVEVLRSVETGHRSLDVRPAHDDQPIEGVEMEQALVVEVPSLPDA